MRAPKKKRAIAKRKRNGLTLDATAFRPTARAREIIDAGARVSGRTVSGQINHLIETAADVENRVVKECKRAFGGEAAYGLGYAIARLASGIEHECRQPWHEDPAASAQLVALLRGLAAFIEKQSASRLVVPDFMGLLPNGEVLVVEMKQPHEKVLAGALEQLLSYADRLYWPLADAAPSAEASKLVPTADDIKRVLLLSLGRDRV